VSFFFLREPVRERVPCTGAFGMMEDNVCVVDIQQQDVNLGL
jgi:hypothetical protein